MATARKSGASACSSSSIIAELCWLMCVIITAGPLPAARKWICPAKVFARPRSTGNAMLLELPLFKFHVGGLDDLGTLRHFQAQEACELLGGTAAHDAAHRGVGVDQLLRLQCRGGSVMDALAILEQRGAGRRQPVPVVGVD